MNVNKVVAEVVAAWRERPFSWEGACCLAFCGAVVAAQTGVDPTEALRDSYSSEMSAKRIMLREGWDDMADLAASFFEEVPTAMARWGDLGFIPEEGTWGSLGVFCGPTIACRTPSGVAQAPRSTATRAFRVRAR